MVATTRKFDGLIYGYHFTYPTKREANEKARTHRTRGTMARVVKVSRGYAIYTR
jgi:hypothetical protein